MSEHTTSDLTNCPEDIHESLCESVCVLPLRYALCSDPTSCLHGDAQAFVDRFCPVPAAEHHGYTLRLLRPGTYVYAFVEGEKSMSQFTVRNDGTLLDGQSESEHFRAGSFWLEVSNLNATVWLAVSDALWTDAFRAEVMASPGTRMQEFNPRTRQSAQSLVSKGTGRALLDELKQVAQEFRANPGYLRSLHEYPGIPTRVFDPDIKHLQEVEMTGITVERRWQWSATPFRWKHQDPDWNDAEAKLKAQTCSLFIALADPVGVAMDCAQLNAAALAACDDLTAWYGPASALAETILVRGRMLSREHTRFGTDPGTGCIVPMRVSDAIRQGVAGMWTGLDSSRAINARFWWAVLSTEGDWSFVHIMGDFDLDDTRSALRAQDALARSIHGLTAHASTEAPVHDHLRDKGTIPFVDLASAVMSAAKPRASGPVLTPRDIGDERENLDALATAFSGLFMHYEPGARLLPASEQLLTALVNALDVYFEDLPAEEKARHQETRNGVAVSLLDRVLTEMEILTEDAGTSLGSPQSGLFFHKFGKSVRAALHEAARPRDEPDPLTAPGAYDTVPIWLTMQQEKKLGLVHITRQGKRLAFTEAVRANLAIKTALSVAKGALIILSIRSTVTGFLENPTPGGGVHAVLSAFTAVTALAETVLGLWDIRNVYRIANITSKLSKLQGPLLRSARKEAVHIRSVSLRAHRHMVGTFPAKSMGRKIQNAIKAGNVISMAIYSADAVAAFQKEEYTAGVGHAVLVGAGFVALSGGTAVAVGLLSLVGATLVQMGTTSRTDYRIQYSYFGEKSALINKTEKREFAGSLTRFSYAKKMTPPHALLNAWEAPRTPAVWKTRNEAILRDLAMFELLELEILGDASYDMQEKRLHFYIYATKAREDSTLTIHKARAVDLGVDITKLLQDACWETCPLFGMYCWYGSIPWDRIEKTQDFYLTGLSHVRRQGPTRTTLEIEVGFTYSREPDIMDADQHLLEEEMAYSQWKNDIDVREEARKKALDEFLHSNVTLQESIRREKAYVDQYRKNIVIKTLAMHIGPELLLPNQLPSENPALIAQKKSAEGVRQV